MARPNTQKKIDFAAKVTPLFAQAKSMVVTENKGLTVEQVNSLRHSFRQSGVTYRVIKNTLSRRIIKSLKFENLEECFTGPTAVAFHGKDESAPIKVLVEFQKKNKEAKIEIKGGWISNQIYNSRQLVEISKLPNRDVLLSQLCSVLQAPVANLAAVMNELLRQVPATIMAVAEQKKIQESK
jgi:large subunit ribosomal protein L10